MIPAELAAKIRRLFHAERWPVGTIARHCGVHHQTVRPVPPQSRVAACPGHASLRPACPWIAPSAILRSSDHPARSIHEVRTAFGSPDPAGEAAGDDDVGELADDEPVEPDEVWIGPDGGPDGVGERERVVIDADAEVVEPDADDGDDDALRDAVEGPADDDSEAA